MDCTYLKRNWVDYKIFVVRYNYTLLQKYVKSATTTATFEQK
jgi:hypothetical protein